MDTPFHQLSKINKPLEDLIDLLVQKPTAVRSRRRTFIDRWARRAKELAPEEAKLKAGMSEHRQKILAPKRIRLFKEMLEDIQYDDLGVVQELIDGATLTGDIPVTGVLDTKLKPARIDIEQLMDVAEQVKQQIKCRTVVAMRRWIPFCGRKLLRKLRKGTWKALLNLILFRRIAWLAPGFL